MTAMPARAVQTADAVLSAILILQDEGIPSSAHQHKSALRGKDGTAFPGYRRVFDTLACCIIHSKSLNLAQIKKDLRSFNIESPIVNHRNHYHICRDEIECDFELFEKAAEDFRLRNNAEAAQRILSLYKGEYLAGFEALWATAKRIEYQEIYLKALDFL